MKLVRDVARTDTPQQPVDPTKINWDAANKAIDEYAKKGYTKLRPTEKQIRLMIDKIKEGDWVQSKVRDGAEEHGLVQIMTNLDKVIGETQKQQDALRSSLEETSKSETERAIEETPNPGRAPAAKPKPKKKLTPKDRPATMRRPVAGRTAAQRMKMQGNPDAVVARYTAIMIREFAKARLRRTRSKNES
jgi:hypothetical protein